MYQRRSCTYLSISAQRRYGKRREVKCLEFLAWRMANRSITNGRKGGIRLSQVSSSMSLSMIVSS